MAERSVIEWTDASWNPVTGCDRVSPGCDRCYALRTSKRLKAMGQPKYQTNGDVRTSGSGFGVAVHKATTPARWRSCASRRCCSRDSTRRLSRFSTWIGRWRAATPPGHRQGQPPRTGQDPRPRSRLRWPGRQAQHRPRDLRDQRRSAGADPDRRHPAVAGGAAPARARLARPPRSHRPGTRIEAAIQALEDPRVCARFSVLLKEFLAQLDAVLPRPEALQFVRDARLLAVLSERPVYYRKLSERLQAILDELAGNWDELVVALQALLTDIRREESVGESAAQPRLPFARLLADKARPIPARRSARLGRAVSSLVRVNREAATGTPVRGSCRRSDRSLRVEVA
jgi:hypothetical protein